MELKMEMALNIIVTQIQMADGLMVKKMVCLNRFLRTIPQKEKVTTLKIKKLVYGSIHRMGSNNKSSLNLKIINPRKNFPKYKLKLIH